MRQMLLMFLVATAPGWACSCLNTATACSAIHRSTVVFVADVIVDSGEGWGERPAKVLITEPLQNVPKGLKEATISTMEGTSCYHRLQAGERYVIITSGPKYAVGGCGNSFLLRGNEHILDAIRNQLSGAEPWLVGTVRKSTGPYAYEGGIPNVQVELSSGKSRRTVTTDSEGRYVFTGLTAGPHKIRVSRDGYLPNDEFNTRWSGKDALNPLTNRIEPVKDEPGEIDVIGRSCEIRDLAMWPAGGIRGTVRGPEGKPLEGVTVQAFGLDQKGRPDSSPLRTAVTDSEGKYVIQPLPAGQFVVGVNARPYNDESPYPPAVYSDGKPVPLGEAAAVAGIDLTVGSPRTAAKLRIKVVNSDGKPHEGATVRLDNPEGVQRWFSRDQTNADGELVAPVWVGERYMVEAFHSIIKNEIVRLEDKLAVHVIDREGTSVTVVIQAER